MNKQAGETKHVLCWRTNTSSWLEEIIYSLQSLFFLSVLLKKQKIYFLKQINEFTWEMWVPHVRPSGCNTWLYPNWMEPQRRIKRFIIQLMQCIRGLLIVLSLIDLNDTGNAASWISGE